MFPKDIFLFLFCLPSLFLPASHPSHSTFSGAWVHVLTLLMVRCRIVFMMFFSMCSMLASRSSSSLAYRASRLRSQIHHIITMKSVIGIATAQYIQNVGATTGPSSFSVRPGVECQNESHSFLLHFGFIYRTPPASGRARW